MSPEDLDLARSLFPRICFDRREPFFPLHAGASVLRSEGPSPSFRRRLEPPPGGMVIEYAIYWDWDIQHLYDLEHVWLYLAGDGALVDAEASFHGKYRKALVSGSGKGGGLDRDSGRLVLYSQPGKHAFSPDPEDFLLLADHDSACSREAGKAGAEVPWPLSGRIAHRDAWDVPVREWLLAQAFEPSWDFLPWEAPEDLVVPWEDLDARLPALFMGRLEELGIK